MTNQNHPVFKNTAGRASSFTSKGSITLEAALAVPVFLFAMLCFLYLMEFMALTTELRNALYSAAKETAERAGITPVITSGSVKRHVVNAIGEDKLNDSMIAGGTRGLDLSRTFCDWNTAVMTFVMKYDVKIPVLMFDIPAIRRTETVRVKGWTGYEPVPDPAGENIVYVTAYGTVYHRSLECTYLSMSVSKVRLDAMETLRNESGGKYYPCESCGNSGTGLSGSLKNGGYVYVTKYGNRYHASLNCGRIKRNISAIPLEEAEGMRGCSKCVK